ncbi:hypothetical protein M3Y96_01224000 [Aphelenchoides besseyi]|nr:hypothetical protein M3Y96_01224000 [Aphelenchoides besseyi]
MEKKFTYKIKSVVESLSIQLTRELTTGLRFRRRLLIIGLVGLFVVFIYFLKSVDLSPERIRDRSVKWIQPKFDFSVNRQPVVSHIQVANETTIYVPLTVGRGSYDGHLKRLHEVNEI